MAMRGFRLFESEERSSGRGEMMKIGEVARRAGVSVETLRFYERSGLIESPRRSEGGFRLYGADVLKALDFIRRAQTLGFSLDEIRRIVAERRAGVNPCAEVRQIVRNRLEELDRRLREMRRYRNDLAAALAEWDRAGEAEGEFCGLIEATEIQPAKAAESKLKRNRK